MSHFKCKKGDAVSAAPDLPERYVKRTGKSNAPVHHGGGPVCGGTLQSIVSLRASGKQGNAGCGENGKCGVVSDIPFRAGGQRSLHFTSLRKPRP
jgi:hypothetical protein